jgi:hypothetical protein
MQPLLFSFALLGALAAAGGSSFAASADTLADSRIPAAGAFAFDRDRVDVDVLADGTVWVRGREYKASFARDGVAYIPFLGSDAPRNYPLDLAVEAVSIAGVELAFRTDAAPSVDGSSVVFDRGSFQERYVLTPDGIEQTFVFDDLPRRGEIAITIDARSELSGRSDADGFRFENERGHVRYGRAFSIDARGDKQSIDSCLDAGRIEIRVAGERVAAAELPLTVDPVITTYNVRAAPIDEFAADTAYDISEGVFFTVFEETFSASDHDVRAVRHAAGGGVLVTQWIDSSATNWADPAVANVSAADQFLVVAAVGQAPNRDIFGRLVGAGADLPVGLAIEVSASLAIHDKHSPDVGGDSWPTGAADYCVVWQASYMDGDDDVRARMVGTDGALLGAGPLNLSILANEADMNPVISNSNGHATDVDQFWNVVFEREVALTNRDLYGLRIDSTGVVTGPANVAGTGADERNASVSAELDPSAGDQPWLLAYQIDAGGNGYDVRVRAMDELVVADSLDLPTLFPTAALHQTEPTCDVDVDGFVVAYTEQASLAIGTTDIRVSSLFWTGSELMVSEGNLSASPGLERDLRPSLCSARSGGSSTGNVAIVFDRDDSGQRNVLSTHYTMAQSGPIEAYCFGDGNGMPCPCNNFGGAGRGCANSASASGARLVGSGNTSIGGDTFELDVDGMPANASVLFFQGSSAPNFGNGTLFGDGLRCAGGTSIRLGTKTAAGGAAHYPDVGDVDVSTRGLVVPGNTRYYQAHYRNSAAFCTASTFNLTNGVSALWIP